MSHRDDTPVREGNNIDLVISKREVLPPWLLGFQYAGDTPGARLRKARLARNMTVADLVRATGLGKPTIYGLEADKATARPPSLRILAGTLNVPISYLGKYEDLPEVTMCQKIRKARLYHGYTKAEFSVILDVDVKTLRCWESGERKPMDRYQRQLEEYFSILSSISPTPSPESSPSRIIRDMVARERLAMRPN